MLEALSAEFILLTGSFRKEIANVVRDIAKVGAALNSLGAGSTGLEKSVASLEKTGAASRRAKVAGDSLVKSLEAQAAALHGAAKAESSLTQARTDALAAARASQTSDKEAQVARRELTQQIAGHIAILKSQEAQIRQTTAAQEQQIAAILRGRQISALSPPAPTGGFGEFAVGGAAALAQQRKELAVASELAAKAERDLFQALGATASAVTAEGARFDATAAALRRNVVIYEQAIAAGLTYAQAQNRIAAAEAGARFATQAHADAIQQLTLQERQLQAQLRQGNLADGLKKADDHARSLLGTIGSILGRIALFSVAAGLVVRGFFAITQAIRDVVTSGIGFNQQMEEGKVAMAALIGTSRELADAQGQTLTFAEAYPGLLQQAEDIQRKIILANATTLGTGEELLAVYRQVVGLSGQQKGTLDDVLEISQLITNVSKIQGLAGEQIVDEARQLFTLESARGQLVLRTLNISIQDARLAEKRGELFDLLREKGAAFLAITEELANSMSGLTSTASTFTSLFAGAAFGNVFNLARQFLVGFNAELDDIIKKGGIAGALAIDPGKVEQLGTRAAQAYAQFVEWVAKASEQLIQWALDLDRIASEIGQSELFKFGQNLIEFVLPVVETFVAMVLKSLDTMVAPFNLLFKMMRESRQTMDDVLGDTAPTAPSQNFALQDSHVRAYNKSLADLSILQKQRTADSQEADKAERQLADALDKLAGAQLRYQEQLAEVSNDPSVFLELQRLRLKEIDTSLKEELLRVKGNEAAITTVKQKAEIDRMLVRAEGMADTLRNIEKAGELYQREAELAQNSARARLDANASVRDAELGSLQLELDIAEQRAGTYSEQIDLIRRIGELQVQQAQDAVRAVQQEIDARKVLILTLQLQQEEALKEANAATDKLSRDTALAHIVELKEQIGAQNVNLIALEGDLAAATARVGTAAGAAAKDMRDATTKTVNFSRDIVGAIDDIYDGLTSGSFDLGNTLEDLAKGIGETFVHGFAEALTAKFDFDATFKNNIGGLSGIFDTFTSGLSSGFSSLFDVLGGDFNDFTTSVADLFDAFEGFDFSKAGAGFSQIGAGFSDMWASLGTGGQVAAANFGADFLIDAFKLNKSQEAKLGATVGMAVGTAIGAYFGMPAVGAAIGKILGAFVGGLFESMPTKGTQIRQGVVKYLQDLEVAFSEEIDSDKYGFGWIEKYRKKTNQGFLEASKEFIPQNFAAVAAAGLEKQLLALGLVITAETAGKLKKDLNQTGVTFANMITENLAGDPKKIQTFIDDLVQQGKFSLVNMIESLNESFLDGRIAADLYNQAIEGTVKLFVKDLPGAIDINKLIANSMVDGLLDVDKLKKQIEIVGVEFAALSEIISAVIQEGIDAASKGKPLSIENFAKSFAAQLGDVLKGAIIQAVTEGIAGALTSGALGGILAQISALANDFGQGNINREDLEAGIKELAATARPEIERLAAAFGPLGEMVINLLRDLGLLPKEIEEAAEAAKELESIDLSGVGQGLIAGIERQMATIGHILPDQLLRDMEIDVGMAMVNGITSGIVEATIKPWLDKVGTQFSKELAGAMKIRDPVIQARELDSIMRRATLNFMMIPKQVQAGLDLLDKWTASPEYKKITNLFRAREMQKALVDTMKGIGNSLVDEIKKQLKETGTIDVKLLAEGLESQIGEAIATAIIDAIIQIAIIGPILEVAMLPFTTMMRTAMEDGVISAAEMAALLAVGSAAMAGIPNAIAAGVELLKGIIPELKGLLDIDATSSGRLFDMGSGSGGGGGGGDGGADRGAEERKRLEDERKALRDAIRALRDTFNEASDTLADTLASIQERLRSAIGEVVDTFPLQVRGAFAMLKQILPSINDFGDLQDFQNLIRDLSASEKVRAENLFGVIRGILQSMGISMAELFQTINEAKREAEEEKKRAIRDFLEPFNDFIRGGESESALSALFREYDELRERLRENAAELIKNGVDVAKLFDDLAKAFEKARKRVIEEFLEPFNDFISGGQSGGVLTDLTQQYEELRRTLRENAAELLRSGVNVAKLFEDLAKAFEKMKKKAIEEFLAPFNDFIRGSQSGDAITALFQQFEELEDRLRRNAAELIKNGVDVAKLWDDLAKALARNIAQIRGEFLAPIRAAMEGIRPGAIRPLAEFLERIGSAKGFDQLTKIRDLAIDAIRRAMDAQIEGVRRISEANIARLRKEHDREVTELNERKTGLARLAQLRQQQLNEELQRIGQMRDAARNLFTAADDLKLSNVSPLAPFQRLNEAQRKFSADLARARGGDIEAAQRLPQLAQQLLAEARTVFASSPQFTAIFNMIQESLRSVGKDLLDQATIAEQQLRKLNNLETIQQEIARLTRELGLRGNESLRELEILQRRVEGQIRILNRELEKAIREEEKLLRDRIAIYQNLAIARLRILQEALERKFDELIEALLDKDLAPELIASPLSVSAPTPTAFTPTSAGSPAFSYDALAEALSRALAERPPAMISIPISIVTPDGSVLENTVLNRLSNDTSRGKIMVNTKGSGRTGLF